MPSPAAKSRFGRRAGYAVLAVVAVAALLRWGPGWVFGPQTPAFAVARRDLVQTVVASGRVEAPLRVDVGSQITGEVVAVPVAEGQAVRAGDTLIALDDRDAQATLEQATAAVRQAEARLRQVTELSLPVAQQTLAQAEATASNAARQFERVRNLTAQGFVGQSQLDDAQRALDVAHSQVRSARLQLQSLAPGGSDRALAQTALAQAQASERVARARLEHTQIRAAVDGTLIARNVERGAVVQPGKALMVLSPAGRTQLVVQIDEKNLRYLQLGQHALAAADAYPGMRFAATLAYINPGVDATRGSVEVKLDVDAPPAFLRQDMTVSVDIEVARSPGALSIETEAVRDAAGAAPWVMVVREGRAARRPVRLGVRGAMRTEVLDGLREGDLVLPATAAAVGEGQRVRAVAAAASAAAGGP